MRFLKFILKVFTLIRVLVLGSTHVLDEKSGDSDPDNDSSSLSENLNKGTGGNKNARNDE